MSNNVRVLAEDRILSHNQGDERNICNKRIEPSNRYIAELEEENKKLKIENREYLSFINEMGREMLRKQQPQTMWID